MISSQMVNKFKEQDDYLRGIERLLLSQQESSGQTYTNDICMYFYNIVMILYMIYTYISIQNAYDIFCYVHIQVGMSMRHCSWRREKAKANAFQGQVSERKSSKA